jgi:hypothetical protein
VIDALYDEIDELEDERAFVDEEDMMDNQAATMADLQRNGGAGDASGKK